MKILEKNNYKKLTLPLQQVTINNLFARAVIEQKVTGEVYVDDKNNPQTFYVIHPYGMTLLFGKSNNPSFNNSFKDYALNKTGSRNRYEWMQAFPNSWDNVLSELFNGYLIKSADNISKPEKGIIELNTRVNFKFSKEKYLANRKSVTNTDIQIVKTDRQMFRDMGGSVVPLYFWDSEDDFLQHGFGYSLFYKNQLASMAFSSYWFGNQFEMGIETKEAFRGKGLAEMVCSALIDYCLQNNYEPIWSCRLENTGSYKLALKLGFEPSLTLPYYRLSTGTAIYYSR